MEIEDFEKALSMGLGYACGELIVRNIKIEAQI